MIGLYAGNAAVTGIGGPLQAVQRFGKIKGKGEFPYAGHSMEQIGMGHTIMLYGILKNAYGFRVTEDVLE
jgi:hypothetical protein